MVAKPSQSPTEAPQTAPNTQGSQGAGAKLVGKGDARVERQAEALRANLHRRKDQARRRAEEAPAPDAPKKD